MRASNEGRMGCHHTLNDFMAPKKQMTVLVRVGRFDERAVAVCANFFRALAMP